MLRLIDHVRSVVADATGVTLRTEVRLVGFPETGAESDGTGAARGRGRRPMNPPDAPTVDERPAIDPRIRQRRVAIQRSQGRRRLRWIGGASGVLVLVAVVVGLLHTPLFSARVVSVSGAHPHTTDAAIVAAAGLDHQPPLISVDPGATAKRVETLPFIATAQVHRHWPDGVTISVTERVPRWSWPVRARRGRCWTPTGGRSRSCPTQPPGLVVLAVATATGAAHPAPVGGTLAPPARSP